MWAEGDRVGVYLLLRQLGTGGMGSVFLARHEETGAERALKVLPSDATQELVERFRREGLAMARVDAHRNVVRVHALEEDRGRPYLVMDRAAGGDLSQRLRDGPLDLEEAARIVVELARGLAHVHAQGVLHRDLKPENVVFDEHGTPKLVDFGLARLAEADSLTATGQILGTPSYMAPEAVAGGAGADERSDVYGLGALLYHLWTGSAPFAGGTAVSILNQVVHHAPLPPSRRNPELGVRANALCLRALAKDPAARPASAAQLGEELEALREAGAIGGGRQQRLALWGLLSVVPLALALLLFVVLPAPAVPVEPVTNAPLEESKPRAETPRRGGTPLVELEGVRQVDPTTLIVFKRVRIEAGEVVTVAQGTTVRCEGKSAGLRCWGTLRMEGTRREPIHLLRDNVPALHVEDGGEAVLTYTEASEVPLDRASIEPGVPARRHSGLVVQRGGTLRLLDCKVTGFKVIRRGAGVRVKGRVEDGSDSRPSTEDPPPGPAVLVCQRTVFLENHAMNGWGGAIHAQDQAQVRLVECTFRENEADQWGGAVYFHGPGDRPDAPSLEVERCRFVGNKALFGGGGLMAKDVAARFAGCEFSRNQVTTGDRDMETGGGAVRLAEGTFELDDCEFEGNTAVTLGGALFSLRDTRLGVRKGAFRRNRVSVGVGGALAARGGGEARISLRAVEFLGNQADLRGGAIYVQDYQSLELRGCDFLRNDAPIARDLFHEGTRVPSDLSGLDALDGGE